jgi:hypothetical protein
MTSRLMLLLSVAVGLVAPSCNDEPAQDSNVQPSTGRVGCSQDPRVKAFAAGLSAASASTRFAATIVTASPSPPFRGVGDGGFNVWTMKLDLDARPVADPKAVTVTTLMPDHGHGSARIPTVTANPDSTFSVGDLYFFMAGVWEITFLTAGESAKFSFCIE